MTEPVFRYAEGVHGRLLELRAEGFQPKRILDIGANCGQSAILYHSVYAPVQRGCSRHEHDGTAPENKAQAMSRRKKAASTADSLVEAALDSRLLGIESQMDADGIAIYGSMLYVMDDLVKTAVEERPGRKKRRLVVVLETDRGSIELVQRIVETIRHHYRDVQFVVPNQAMSAGTVLALSGDDIWMNYYSRLGPIDPQITRGNRLLPAVGYLELYEEFIRADWRGSCSRIVPADHVVRIIRMKTKTQNKSTTKIKGVPSSDAERLEMVRKALSTIRNVRACRGGNRESVTLPIGRRDLAIDSRK